MSAKQFAFRLVFFWALRSNQVNCFYLKIILIISNCFFKLYFSNRKSEDQHFTKICRALQNWKHCRKWWWWRLHHTGKWLSEFIVFIKYKCITNLCIHDFTILFFASFFIQIRENYLIPFFHVLFAFESNKQFTSMYNNKHWQLIRV